MGRILTITNSNETKTGVGKKTLKREIVIGPSAIKFVTIAIFGILLLVYLAQSTAGANRSVRVREYTDKQAELELQKERLEVEKYRLESLSEIDSQVEKATMEPISQVNHLNDNQKEIARN